MMRILMATLGFVATLSFGTALTGDQTYHEVVRPFEGHSLQIVVPQEYAHEQSASPQAGTLTLAFSGPVREDGTRPMIQVTVIKLPAEVSLEMFAAQMIKAVERRRTDWELESSEVTIGEAPGRRFAWRGAASPPGAHTVRMGGVMFVGIDAGIGFALHTQDVESHASSALPVGETSLRTFRVK